MDPVDIEELNALVENLKKSTLNEEDQEKLQTMADCYRYLVELVREDGATVEGVRERFFKRYKFVSSGGGRSADDTDPGSDAGISGT